MDGAPNESEGRVRGMPYSFLGMELACRDAAAE